MSSLEISAKVRSSIKNWMPSDLPGAYVSVDGQFGSCGKGLINAVIGVAQGELINAVVSNAGPNSGHSHYEAGHDGTPVLRILKQLPSSAAAAWKMEYHGHACRSPRVHLSAGAVIDPDILENEMVSLHMPPNKISIHQHAAVINPAHKFADEVHVKSIAGTGSGVGPALVGKMSRNMSAVAKGGLYHDRLLCKGFYADPLEHVFMEVSQGFSLGINSGMYPHVTSRECTVSQAMSDAGMSPRFFRKSVMSLRTFPIRVGSTQNTSGPPYPDQTEISWESLGQKPELTTVTKRVRRVFTWSPIQYRLALLANTPDMLFLNFCNYLQPGDVEHFVVHEVVEPYWKLFHKIPIVLLGWGPMPGDVTVWEG